MHRVLWEYIRKDSNQCLGGQEKLPRRGDLNPKGQVEMSQTEKPVSVGNERSKQKKRYVQIELWLIL